MSQYGFGTGELFGITSDANPTPVRFGTLQEINIDFNFSMKELHGNKQFPEAIGRTKSKIAGKAKMGRIYSGVFSSLFFNQAASTGQRKAVIDETGTIPGTPYTVTVANSANFQEDLGVKFTSGGQYLTRVASSPTTGQYSVSAGVYTFAAADTTKGVLISYTWNYTASGKLITVTSQLMGLSPTFKVILNNIYDSKQITVILYKCMSSKLTLPSKNDDFLVHDFDFEAMADDSGNIVTLSMEE